jgi:tetratricopeptide (TPR) repeat protein
VDYENAEIYFKLALSYDENFLESYMMLGELYSRQNKYAPAVENYKTAFNIDSSFYRPAYFNLANAEMMIEDYSGALLHYKAYLRSDKTSEKNRLLAIKNIKNCEFAIQAILEPVSFNPVSVGNNINTKSDEYWPSITADGKTLMLQDRSLLGIIHYHSGRHRKIFYQLQVR